jgi:predicted Fe-Mo cluster-binding NifX family protein
MKIAVATDDFSSVTGHVGRCNGFLVIEIDNNEIINTEKRENQFTNHKISKNHDHSHGHSHAGLVEGLRDCSHLICTAAGWRLQEDLKSAGIDLVFTNEKNAHSAALKFAEGKLELNPGGVCHSH